MATGNREAGRRTEEIWRDKLRQADIRYQLASVQYRQSQAEFLNGSVSPDGECALRKALRAENEARADYIRVLRLFTQLILHGERPDENTSETG